MKPFSTIHFIMCWHPHLQCASGQNEGKHLTFCIHPLAQSAWNLLWCSIFFETLTWQKGICLSVHLLECRLGRQTRKTGVQSHDPALTWMKEMVTLLETKQGKGESEGLAGQPSNNGVRALRPQATQRPEKPPPSHSHIAMEPAFHTGLWTAIQSNYCLTWPLASPGIRIWRDTFGKLTSATGHFKILTARSQMIWRFKCSQFFLCSYILILGGNNL